VPTTSFVIDKQGGIIEAAEWLSARRNIDVFLHRFASAIPGY